MKVIKDIYYSDFRLENQKLDIYLPDSDNFSVFVFFHGGGLENGDKADADVFVPYLLERNVAVISANYRVYPNAVYPEFIQDAAAAVAWTFKNINNYGQCNKIHVGGSSAGAYLSMMLCFDKQYLAWYGIDPSEIASYIHNAGQPTCHFNVLKEHGLDNRRTIIDEKAPLFHIGTADSYSPLLFIVSDNDLVSRYEQIMLTISTLKHFYYDDSTISLKIIHGNHCQHDFAIDDNGESVFGKLIYEFINKI